MLYCSALLFSTKIVISSSTLALPSTPDVFVLGYTRLEVAMEVPVSALSSLLILTQINGTVARQCPSAGAESVLECPDLICTPSEDTTPQQVTRCRNCPKVLKGESRN